MINKIYKIIHNKFSSFFKFVFFLRYLIVIFFVAIALFLIIPYFFDYKKKEKIITNYLSNFYGIEVNKLEKINYRFYPVPHLRIHNLKANFLLKDVDLHTEEIIIYPKLSSIYNYENLDVNNIKFQNTDINVDFNNIKFFTEKIINLKKKLSFGNLDIKINENKDTILQLQEINFLNYGNKKNFIIGKVFNRKFKIELRNKLQNITFKLFDTGVFAELILKDNYQNQKFEGNLKGKILKSNFIINFIYDSSSFKIKNFYLRDKNLSLDSNGYIKFKPFFKIQLNSQIKNIEFDIFKNFNIKQIINSRDLIKRLNTKLNFIYKSKKFSKDLIDYSEVKTQLEIGRLSLFKNFLISKNNFICNSEINLLDDFPIYYFNCTIDSPNLNELLKKIRIDDNIYNEAIKLKIEGNFNIFKNKVNFDNIEINGNYKANLEELKYYKKSFQNIFFKDNYLDLFNLEKIRNFILEIS